MIYELSFNIITATTVARTVRDHFSKYTIPIYILRLCNIYIYICNTYRYVYIRDRIRSAIKSVTIRVQSRLGAAVCMVDDTRRLNPVHTYTLGQVGMTCRYHTYIAHELLTTVYIYVGERRGYHRAVVQVKTLRATVVCLGQTLAKQVCYKNLHIFIYTHILYIRQASPTRQSRRRKPQYESVDFECVCTILIYMSPSSSSLRVEG